MSPPPLRLPNASSGFPSQDSNSHDGRCAVSGLLFGMHERIARASRDQDRQVIGDPCIGFETEVGGLVDRPYFVDRPIRFIGEILDGVLMQGFFVRRIV
jgi:hypothetical protein